MSYECIWGDLRVALGSQADRRAAERGGILAGFRFEGS